MLKWDESMLNSLHYCNYPIAEKNEDKKSHKQEYEKEKETQIENINMFNEYTVSDKEKKEGNIVKSGVKNKSGGGKEQEDIQVFPCHIHGDLEVKFTSSGNGGSFKAFGTLGKLGALSEKKRRLFKDN